MFELTQAAVAVRQRTLLHPFDGQFLPGRFYGLLGHNGSGKSTLIRLLARELAPSQGTLRCQGRALVDWSVRDFARQVAYLPQHTPALDDHTRVRDLVALGRYPWCGLLGRLQPHDHALIDQALADTQMQDDADRTVASLSGGERQRAWLAVLLAQQSPFLLMDEPLAALDIAHQVDVMALVQRLVRERGLGVVMVIHDINLAARYCDELLALRQGRLVFQGSPQDLMTPAQLEAIYGVRMQVLPHPGHAVPVAFV